MRSESHCALRHEQICTKCLRIKLNGFRPYRHSWTSLPAPFISVQRLSELPLPCVTMCHHISTGLYHSLSAQRLSERTVLFSCCKESVCVIICTCSLELVLKQEQEEYQREGIEWKKIDYFNNQIICDLVEQPHKGVIAIMDEACLNVGKITDEVFCYHVIVLYIIFCEILIEWCYGKFIFVNQTDLIVTELSWDCDTVFTHTWSDN